MALIGEEPTARLLVANVATPPLSVPVPSVVVPERNVTVPVGVPAPGARAETVAVNVTDWSYTVGLTEDSNVVVVLSWFTTWVVAVEVLPRSLVSPPYMAVIGEEPTARLFVENVATPLLRVPVPSVVVPERNVTVPVGVPAPGATTATVAVNVTD